MKLFKKQETPTGNLALLGIFAAIMGAFSIILALVPFSNLVLGLFLPLISAVAAYYTENKYLPAYIIVLWASRSSIGGTPYLSLSQASFQEVSMASLEIRESLLSS